MIPNIPHPDYKILLDNYSQAVQKIESLTKTLALANSHNEFLQAALAKERVIIERLMEITHLALQGIKSDISDVLPQHSTPKSYISNLISSRRTE